MDIIVVLGAQNDALGRLSEMALARAQGAVEQYCRRPGAKLVVTGGYGRFNPSPQPHARYMAAHLIEQGVDPDDILAQIESAHTVEDAVLTRQLLMRQFLDAFVRPRCANASSTRVGTSSPAYSIIVVTSKVHVPRAQLIFEHFFSPAQLAFVGTPDAVSPEHLQKLRAHEAEQIARIRQQGGVIYGGKIQRRSG